MNNLLILSPCFYETAQEALLMVESAHVHGLEVQLFGVEQPFIPHGADAQVLRLYKLMQQEQLADYVIVSDCRDVLFLAEQEEILFKFHTFNSPIVMSTETGCWPPDPEVVEYFAGKSPHGYDYINAGQYIGEWYSVRLALWSLLDNYRDKHTGLDNSQGWWARAKMHGQIGFALDHECKIFQTMSGGVDGHVLPIGNRVLNTVTGEMPCSVHFNGNPGVKEPQRKLWNTLNESTP